MRKGNWRSALYRYFDEIRRKPFDKNSNNCAQFIANGWLVMRNDDPFKPYRKYKTFEAMLKAARKDGYEKHEDFFKTIMREYDHPSRARTGDIALFTTDDEIGTASGFVVNDRVFVLRQDGLASLSLADAIKAFEV
jgi:hypothetical protein